MKDELIREIKDEANRRADPETDYVIDAKIAIAVIEALDVSNTEIS